MIPTQILYDGQLTPAPAAVELRAGPLNVIFENGDLRYVRLGEVEVLRRVYVAIRDRDWGTVAPVFSNLQVAAGDDWFEISFDARNQQDEIDFGWHAHFTGRPDGRLSLQMDGVANSSFWRNRIGFCVLLPAACAGQPCRVEHLDGSLEVGELPVDIDARQPVLPFSAMRCLEYGLPGSQAPTAVRAEVLFSGDAFEMEDQRNWTDASYKIFSTPLALPFPVLVPAGERIAQALAIAVHSSPPGEDGRVHAPAAAPRQSSPPNALSFSLADALPPAALPRIGVGMASHGEPLTDLEIKRLRALHLSHLRADLLLSDPAYPHHLQAAARQAADLQAGLELAVFVSQDMDAELSALRARLEEIFQGSADRLARVLVYPSEERYQGSSPTVEVVRAAHAHLGPFLGRAVPLGCGSNTDFIFLKRTPQPAELVDCLAVALNPQVHAFDNASLVETLEAQPVTIASARRLSKGRPVLASPITLKPRFNPYATEPAPVLPPGELPPQVDPRQVSLFAAGWTLGSLRAMLLGGAASVTYYETTGWRGVMEVAAGSPLPQAFHSLPGAVFPLYHVLAAVGGFSPAGGQQAMAQALPCARPLQASAWLLRSSEQLRSPAQHRSAASSRLLLASHSPQPLPICLEGLPGPLRLRVLDENSAESAMSAPEAFWSQPAESITAPGGQLCLTLRPYALVFADLF